MSNFNELPSNLKPREKFLSEGGENLNVIELLAIVLRTGSKQKSVIELSYHLLGKYSGLNNLLNQSIEELMQNNGVGLNKAILIKSLKYLFIEVESEIEAKEELIIKEPEMLYQYMKRYGKEEEEQFYVVCLANNNKVLGHQMIFKGSINQITLSPREIFKYVLSFNSNKIFLVHNHPSGDLTASKADVNATKHLIEMGNLIGINIVDHIIISSKGYLSLKEEFPLIFD